MDVYFSDRLIKVELLRAANGVDGKGIICVVNKLILKLFCVMSISGGFCTQGLILAVFICE